MTNGITQPGDIGHNATSARHEGRIYDRVKAKVVDVNDPNEQGRVRLFIPSLMSGPASDRSQWSDWAFPAMLHSENGDQEVGTFFVPPVNSWIWCDFVEGSFEYPRYHGGFWRAGRLIPALARGASDSTEGTAIVVLGNTVPASSAGSSTYPLNRLFKTPEGIIVELDDSPGNRRIRIRHPSGSQTEYQHPGDIITNAVGDVLNGAQGAMRLVAEGEMKLATSLSLSSQSVLDTTISSNQNINVVALVAATLQGATASVISAAASLTLGAADATLAASGLVKLGSAAASANVMLDSVISKFNSHGHTYTPGTGAPLPTTAPVTPATGGPTAIMDISDATSNVVAD